ncbi:MAG: isocitrate lyase/PEP mutase family protein [Pseudomonadota bacterium]
MTRGQQFRARLARPPVVCMGAHDAVAARLAERAGAPAVYVSGFAAAAVLTGGPDLGLISQAEMGDHIRRICAATTLPVIADADTGYGGILNVQRTLALWQEAGAAGLHIEDQVMPKRCGHVAGKAVIPVAEMQQKLRAAVDARRDPSFFIIARTDALAVAGIGDAIERCRAYAETGVDGLFVDAPESIDHIRAIATQLRPLGKPLLFNAARTGKSPFVSVGELEALGFGIVIYPVEPLFAAHKAVDAAMRAILAEGGTNAVAPALTSFKDFNDFIGMTEMVAREQRYAAPAPARRRT